MTPKSLNYLPKAMKTYVHTKICMWLFIAKTENSQNLFQLVNE